jgi:ABC-type cobalamin/Fe3+-siderophores transport system ATPase subunit
MEALLSLRGVSLSFLRGRRHVVRVMEDISVDVFAGELVAVFAPPAQGKTTLLRVAAGAETPQRGCVLFGGRDLHGLPDRHWSDLLLHEIGWIERRRPHLDLAVVDLVALPLLDRHDRRRAYALAREVIERVGLRECEAQHWDMLADWERALMTLAVGLARGPRLLVADDLMTGLGIGATEELGRMLREVAHEQQFAVLMSVSDLHATTWCDRVATLAGGRLIVAPPTPPEENVIEFPGEAPRRAS